MRKTLTKLLVTAAVVATPSLADAAADFLVTKSGDTFQPGAATAWAEEGGAVLFTLAAGVNANDVAKLLGERLATARSASRGARSRSRACRWRRCSISSAP